MPLRHRSSARTHPGLARQINEDALLVRDDAALWAVADGMGGYENGQWASATLVDALAKVELASSQTARAARIAQALAAGNHVIHATTVQSGKQSGTTAVVVHVVDSTLLCLWVGDSRLYRYRAGALALLTRDHTLVQELVNRGALAPADAEDHPMGHVLSRAVGSEADLHCDELVDAVAPGDRYLLCSDGLSKVVPEQVIAQVLAAPGIDAAADRLLHETLARGAPDNVSLIVVSIEEATAVPGRSGADTTVVASLLHGDVTAVAALVPR